MDSLARKSARAEGFCFRRPWAGWSEERGRPVIHVGRLRCKSWYCRRCVRRNARRAAAKFLNLPMHMRWWHQVITWNPANGDQLDSVEQIGRRWSQVAKCLRKRYPGYKAGWVIELTKRGYAHLHILQNRPVPQLDMQELCKNHGLGYITYDREIRDRNAVLYLVKYLGKMPSYNIYYQALFAETSARRYQLPHGMHPDWKTETLRDFMLGPRDMLEWYMAEQYVRYLGVADYVLVFHREEGG